MTTMQIKSLIRNIAKEKKYKCSDFAKKLYASLF